MCELSHDSNESSRHERASRRTRLVSVAPSCREQSRLGRGPGPERPNSQAVAPFSVTVTNTSSTYSLSKSASFLACSRRVPPSSSNPTTALFSAGMVSCRSCTITPWVSMASGTTKEILSSGAYASSADFERIFTEDLTGLYLLSLLLTGDRDKSEECFVAGVGGTTRANRVFKEFARACARLTIIQRTIRHAGPGSIPARGREVLFRLET